MHGVTGNLKKTRLFFPFISTFFLVILLNNWLGLIPGVGTVRLIVDEEAHQIEKVIEEKIEGVKEIELKNTDEHSNTLVEPVHASESEEEVIHSEHHGPKAVPIFRPGTADLNTTAALAIISVLVTQVIGIKYLKLNYFKKFINTTSPLMFFVGILEIVSEFAKIISFLFRLFGNIFAGEVLLSVMAFLLPLVVPMPFYGLELFVGFIQALVFAMLSLVFFNMATLGHEEH